MFNNLKEFCKEVSNIKFKPFVILNKAQCKSMCDEINKIDVLIKALTKTEDEISCLRKEFIKTKEENKELQELVSKYKSSSSFNQKLAYKQGVQSYKDTEQYYLMQFKPE